MRTFRLAGFLVGLAVPVTVVDPPTLHRAPLSPAKIVALFSVISAPHFAENSATIMAVPAGRPVPERAHREVTIVGGKLAIFGPLIANFTPTILRRRPSVS